MSNIAFKNESLNVESIFCNADYFYQMLDYQRPYSWEKEQVEQLWTDIDEAYRNHRDDTQKDENYFLGSLVVVSNKNKGAFDVVDGQQRLTTLMILFCVLRDLNILDLKDYRGMIEESISCARKQSKKRLKLTTQLNNQITFEQDILNSINFEEIHQSSNRFLQTAKYFKDLIEQYHRSDLLGLV